MKIFFLLLSASLLGLAIPHSADTILTGKITDDKGEALIGAAVKVWKDTALVRSALTDYNGEYRLQLDPGTYDLEFSYTGFVTARITGVPVLAGQFNFLNSVLSEGAVLNEVVVTSFKIPLIEQDKTSGGAVLSSEDLRSVTTPVSSVRREGAKSVKPASTPAGAGKTGKDDAAPAETRPPAPPTEPAKPLRDERREVEIGDYEETISIVTDIPATAGETAESPMPDGPRTQPAPRAGLLTAGEWNDLHNWSKHWVDLLADGEIEQYQTMYGFHPKNRYAVLLQNEEGFPVVDVEIQLVNLMGRQIWSARTDNLGRAELWSGMFREEKGAVVLLAQVDGKSHKFPAAKPFAEGINHLKIKRECQAPKNVDIVWAVDATGSMGDEIEYLKTELLDVIGRVKTANPDLAVRMGTVFYRDKGDEYLAKSSGLSPDIRQTVDYIQKQYADGGGDYPEAVDAALEEAIFRQSWSNEAVARICFLVLDASPHQTPEAIASLQKSIREAARRGIRIVPVSASGIQKDTEFLMKFFGLATNGSYVFLTDHSGIGGKHIEPTTDEYKVELLNDLLVRLITEYATVETCEGKTPILFADAPQQNQQQQGQNDPRLTPSWRAFYYPNPAAHQFTLDLPCAVQSVTLYDAEGKAVRKLEKPREGANLVAVGDLAEGFYTIRILKDGRMQSGKLMVVRS